MDKSKCINNLIGHIVVNMTEIPNSINIEKTKATIFNLQLKIDNINFKMRDTKLTNVDNFNYLGIINTNLNWSHI